MALTNRTKNTTTLENRAMSSPTLSPYSTLIETGFMLLIDDTYELLIQPQTSGTALTNVTKST